MPSVRWETCYREGRPQYKASGSARMNEEVWEEMTLEMALPP